MGKIENSSLIKRAVLKFIRVYQFFSKFTPPTCRFTPTCSRYTYEAIQKYGVLKGGYLGVKRILKCHPYYKGDLNDPVP